MKLLPPCGYKGGKRRYGEIIANQILSLQRTGKIWDVCCGSGAVTLALINKGISSEDIICVEAGPWALFWKSVADETFDIDYFESMIYKVINMDQKKVAEWVETTIAKEEPSAERFIILQACAYGAEAVWWDNTKWRRGHSKTNRNYCARKYWEPGLNSKEKKPRGTMFVPQTVLEMTKSILNRAKGLSVIQGDAQHEVVPVDGDIVYIDPPYYGVSGYGWELDVLKLVEKLEVPMIVSEGKELPGSDRVIVLDSRKSSSLRGGSKKGTEYLNFFKVQSK